MRFLLTFYSKNSHQWRCLDSAYLDSSHSLGLADLPEVLNQTKMIAVNWMQGHRQFRLSRPKGRSDRQDQDEERIGVYTLDPQREVIGQGQEYHGVWLEMFMEVKAPIGWITAHKPAMAGTAFDALQQRALVPLHARTEACQKAISQMRTRQQMQHLPPDPTYGADQLREKI